VAIGDNETMGELAIRMSNTGGPLLTRTLKEHAAGILKPTPQPHDQATHAPKCEKTDAAIDWTLSAQEIHNRIRGYNPAPGAYAEFAAQRVKLLKSELVNNEEILKTGAPGEIVSIMKDRIIVNTGANSTSLLSITEVQPAGKKPMNAADWARNLKGTLKLC